MSIIIRKAYTNTYDSKFSPYDLFIYLDCGSYSILDISFGEWAGLLESQTEMFGALCLNQKINSAFIQFALNARNGELTVFYFFLLPISGNDKQKQQQKVRLRKLLARVKLV